VLDGYAGKTSVDFHSVDQDGLGDHLVSGHLLEDLVVSGFIANDVVVGFVFDFPLGPFFLLGGLVARGCSDCFGLVDARNGVRVSGSYPTVSGGHWAKRAYHGE
jgi:hypothetical protein